MSRHAAAALATLLALAIPAPVMAQAKPMRVLFIGNSLTYTNDLPGVLATMAASTRDTIYAASVTYANFALVDHLSSGSARAAIGADRWEYVILQQGPTSTTGVDRDTLILAARAFEPLIRAAGGTPALYMAWPDITRRSFWDNCRDSYRMAAIASIRHSPAPISRRSPCTSASRARMPATCRCRRRSAGIR